MAIPDFQSIILPSLELAGDGEFHKFINIVYDCANGFGLPVEFRQGNQN